MSSMGSGECMIQFLVLAMLFLQEYALRVIPAIIAVMIFAMIISAAIS